MARPPRGARVKDRISALPDALVCHILSFLPTVCAVRTTVLSTRWNKKWTLVPNLHVRDSIEYSGELLWKDCDDFMTFVDRVLFFRGSSEIQKLCLACVHSKIDFARVDSWICTAIWRNVVELDLYVDMGIQRTFELPQILFTCKTLKVLRLLSNFITNPPPTTECFPSLKVLFVQFYRPGHDDNTPLAKLLSICPLLEQLTVQGTLGGGGEFTNINISAPQLKMLKIDLSFEPMWIDDQYHFCINAPKLENFDVLMRDLSIFSFEINANSLFKVNIDFVPGYEEQHDHRIAILEAISHVKHPSLSTPTLEATQGGLPAFDNLNHLELTLFGSNYWEYLIEFLKRSPNLEYLVINQFTWRHLEEEDFQHDELNPPEFVPVCMLSHLKTITIKGFEGKQDEMKVAKYLLKKGEVLDKMTIFTRNTGCPSSLPNAEEKALYKEFLMFERGSKTCQVEIFN